jgi:hypothetical protein
MRFLRTASPIVALGVPPSCRGCTEMSSPRSLYRHMNGRRSRRCSHHSPYAVGVVCVRPKMVYQRAYYGDPSNVNVSNANRGPWTRR